jgi:hypothetical protein
MFVDDDPGLGMERLVPVEQAEEERVFAGGQLRPYLEAEEWLEEEERTLEATYWLFNEPNIPNMVSRAGDFLDAMYDRYQIQPVDIDGSKCLFEMRYEIAKYREDLTYTEAILPNREPFAFMDFLSGVPFNAVEMKIKLWEISTENFSDSPYPVVVEVGAAPPVPDEFFDESYRERDTLFNYLWLDHDMVDAFRDGLTSEQQTELLWWTRENLEMPDEVEDPRTFPVPGEFVALGVRLFPTKPWGDQSTSPFLFSGNWFDTLYYTTAIVEEISEPTDTRPFRLYKVKWRGQEEDMDDEDYNKFWARPSGFEEYKVDDRVTIIKDVETERKTQTWKDDQEFQEIIWRIAPISFYEMERE